MEILVTKESLSLFEKTKEVMGYEPDYFESDDYNYAWSPEDNVYFVVEISTNENIKPKLVIGDNLSPKYEDKATELIIFSQKNGFKIDFDFPPKYKDSTHHIQSAFLSFEEKNKFSKEESNSIQQGWEPMGMSMYMLMHKHNLIDENLKRELAYLGTFDFYKNLCK